MILLALSVFTVSLAYDWVATRVLVAVESRSAHPAAFLSMLLEAFSWLYVVAFVEHGWWLVVPSMLGAYLGTLISVRMAPADSRRTA